MLARTPGVAAKLAAAFRGRDVEKTYWAVVAGRPVPAEGRIDLPLRRVARRARRAHRARRAGRQGRGAGDHRLTVRSTTPRASSPGWSFNRLTGRTHQLRVHCVALGAPILGDVKYAEPDQNGAGSADRAKDYRRFFTCMPGRCACLIQPAERYWWRAALPPHMRETFQDARLPGASRPAAATVMTPIGGRKRPPRTRNSDGMAEKRSRRGLRAGLIVLAILVLAPVAALVLFAALFDPNAYKPQIAEAVKRATGRDLALNGPVRLKLALHPAIEARDVAFANIEGGSRPQMATLDRLDAQIALLPLLQRRLEIDRLVLVRPDILLETNAEGRPNWRFGPSVRVRPFRKRLPRTPAKRRPRSSPYRMCGSRMVFSPTATARPVARQP